MNHEHFMRKALDLAKKAEGLTKTNPMVGAVLIKDHQIVAEGFHRYFGAAHAEVDLLDNFKGSISNDLSLYLTLEPCFHTDKKTPPCLPLLLKSGIKKIFIASEDPNEKVNSKSIKALKENGIEVQVGICDFEQRKLNEKFYKNMNTGSPFLHVKTAQSLDGKMCLENGISQWITGPLARKKVHQMRSTCDAIMVGGNTHRIDSPSLSVRDLEIINHPKFEQPVKIICSKETNHLKSKKDWLDYFKEFYTSKGIGSIFIEAGPNLFGTLLELEIIDRLSLFIAPIFIGEGKSLMNPKREVLDNLTKHQYEIHHFEDGDFYLDIRF